MDPVCLWNFPSPKWSVSSFISLLISVDAHIHWRLNNFEIQERFCTHKAIVSSRKKKIHYQNIDNRSIIEITTTQYEQSTSCELSQSKNKKSRTQQFKEHWYLTFPIF